MSRTYRRKSGFGKTLLAWELFDWNNYSAGNPNPPLLDPKSEEGKRRIARYHSDASRTCHTEPGPSWFRTMFVERPQRQEARMKIHRYFRDPEYVVLLNAKNPRDYWT